VRAARASAPPRRPIRGNPQPDRRRQAETGIGFLVLTLRLPVDVARKARAAAAVGSTTTAAAS
jgi:hypothetical protein